MILTAARVEQFRSVLDSTEVALDPRVTTLVGRNESGKTAFLRALECCLPVAGVQAEVARDYPRKFAHDYRRRHPDDPAQFARLGFELNPAEVAAVNASLGYDQLDTFRFAVTFDYQNQKRVRFSLDETPYVKHLVSRAGLNADARSACESATTLRELMATLAALDLNAEGRGFLDSLIAKFGDSAGWESPLEHAVWREVGARLPRFFYFDEYTALPDKVNLPDLARRAAAPESLRPADRTALALLDLAGVDAAELAEGGDYEAVKSRLEGAANAVADTVFRYWTQGRPLDVELDVRPDPADAVPFNVGSNLYVRVRDRQDRSSVPFGRRSRGFVWFFSFVVGFEAMRRRPGELILLLDEPGLSLHPTAQADLLRYTDALADAHQVILTTHSPFLIRPRHLGAVRLVEDRGAEGTVVTADLTGCRPETVYPLRTAVESAAAARLAGEGRALYVAGVAEVIYLRLASTQLESAGREGLAGARLVPAGGLLGAAAVAAVGVATASSVLVNGDQSAEQLGGPEVVAVGRFRAPPPIKASKHEPVEPAPATIEDLFSISAYLKLVNAAYAGKLPRDLKEADLPPSDGGILGRIAASVPVEKADLWPRGGIDPVLVATQFASAGAGFDKATLARFAELLAACRGE